MLIQTPKGYQLQFGSPDYKVEKVVTDETRMRKTLKGFYGGRASSGRLFMVPEKGIDLEAIENDDFTMTPLFDDAVSCILPCWCISTNRSEGV